MRTPHFDLDALRSFASGIALGSFARAAVQLHRSTSAVSAQLKKLEQQAGAPLLQRHGRGLALTASGELLLDYAQRLLALNDAAVAALDGAHWQGEVRLGLQAEFGEQLLPEVLGRFARAHPRLRVEAQIDRSGALVDGLASGRHDLVLVWSGGQAAPPALAPQRLATLPLCWIGPAAPGPARHDDTPLALALLDAPCPMRSAALAALDQAGLARRVAFSSASLAGVWAAVAAGLGITLRTPLCVPPGLQVLAPATLPALPTVDLLLYQTGDSPALQALAGLVRQAVDARLARLPRDRAGATRDRGPAATTTRPQAQASGSSDR